MNWLSESIHNIRLNNAHPYKRVACHLQQLQLRLGIYVLVLKIETEIGVDVTTNDLSVFAHGWKMDGSLWGKMGASGMSFPMNI